MTTHRSIKNLITSLTLIISIAILTPNIVEAAYNTGNPVKDQLLDIAQAKLDAEYNTLINGNAKDLTAENLSLKGKAAEKEKETATMQLNRHNGLAENSQRYTQFSSSLDIKTADIQSNQSTIKAEESVNLTLMSEGSTEPILVQEGKTHIFHFVKEGEKWRITEDQEVGGLQPAQLEEGVTLVKERPLSLKDRKKNEKDAPSRNKLGKITGNNVVLALMSGTYNPTNAVNYANSYWNNYNTAYRNYSTLGGDCTNFVSQAVNWGGWQHNGGFYLDYHYWWYSPGGNIEQWGNKGESRSWTYTNGLYWFARYSGRAFSASSWGQFYPGDILQVDKGEAGRQPDGALDHTYFVTKVDNNNIYLTAHNTNVHDVPFFGDLANRWPGAKWYGTLPYYQY